VPKEVGERDTMGLTVDEMHLSPNARRAAELVLAEHPDVIFTSGRRDAMGQARAMAVNTIRYGVDWLGQTYRNQEMVQQLKIWMARNPERTSSEKLMALGFYDTLIAQQAGQLAQFPHCRGDAFDIQCPRFESGQIDEQAVLRIQHTIETLPVELGLQLILTREGSLRIIHAQFAHTVEPVSI
jgi:hypothetical protein